MKCRLRKQLFEPYKDIIIFVVTLFVANYFWKFTMVGDEDGEMVTWFGIDVTAPFEYMVVRVAAAVYWLVDLVRDTAYMIGDRTIRFESGVGTIVIWGCSGLKQMFIWTCLILTVPATEPAYKTWLHKLWFIPLGWLCCHGFNILRIALISLFIEFHPDWFQVLHDYIFKYAFYAMLFGLWVLFVEKIRPSSSAS
jgi:exosortase/archaeosortase family protein